MTFQVPPSHLYSFIDMCWFMIPSTAVFPCFSPVHPHIVGVCVKHKLNVIPRYLFDPSLHPIDLDIWIELILYPLVN